MKPRPRIFDVFLSLSEFNHLDAKFRFRLGVGLAKLGLFDQSVRHVSLSSTPWEAPLYRLRAKFIFPAVHTSLRALALAVDEFEKQAEAELSRGPPRSSLMHQLCNSLIECSLALQSLPLLHFAGYSAPLNGDGLTLGHSPVALPALLGEVFTLMCPPSTIPENFTISVFKKETYSKKRMHSKRIKSKNPLIRIGILSGSMDGLAGRIVIGKISIAY